MQPDVRGSRWRVGERECAVEGNAGFRAAAELHQQESFHAEEIEVIRKPLSERLHHRQRGRGTAHLRDGYHPIL